MTWWKVRPVTGDEVMVLVVAGRVAVASDAFPLVVVGEKWGPARERLETIGFKCTMETL